MPRLDFNDAVFVGLIDSQEEIYHDRDPGSYGPWDMCLNCYNSFNCSSDVEHPPYISAFDTSSQYNYKCAFCNATLSNEDE